MEAADRMTPLQTVRTVYLHGSPLLFAVDAAVMALIFGLEFRDALLNRNLTMADAFLLGSTLSFVAICFLKLAQYMFFFFRDSLLTRHFSFLTSLLFTAPVFGSQFVWFSIESQTENPIILALFFAFATVLSSLLFAVFRYCSTSWRAPSQGWLYSRFWGRENDQT